MKLYLKWYYGYKNWGDELLVLWLIHWLWEEYTFEQLVIETKDPIFLSQRIDNCKKIVKWTHLDNIVCVGKKNPYQWNKEYLHVFWGGEVFSDARPFPYNGRNYFLWFLKTIMNKNFIVLWGIGTEKKRWTKFLYRYMLWYAQKVVVRDEWSYAIAKKYCNEKHLVLYHDFAYDVLDDTPSLQSRQIVKKLSNFPPLEKPYIVINVNVYLRNDEVIDKCRQIVKLYPQHHYYFFSAALGSDEMMMEKWEALFGSLSFYDWTQHSLEETLLFIKSADFVLAARLHVLLVAQYFNVPFEAIVYQEKIEKVDLRKNKEKRTKS